MPSPERAGAPRDLAPVELADVLPPVGICLIVICGVSKVSLSEVTRPLLPYIAVMFLSLLVIMYIPWITLIIPKMVHLY